MKALDHVFFDRINNRLVYTGEKSSPEFWDAIWNENDLQSLYQKAKHGTFVTWITKRFLKPSHSVRILEAGCGNGQHVYALHSLGYDVYGIDFARETVAKIIRSQTELAISCQDIRKTSFDNDFFDAYWSLGVIEHFYEGYDKIIDEAHRVLKSEGLLFVTFPQLSLLRRIKCKLGLYLTFNEKNFEKNRFYQFALDWREVRNNIEKKGFILLRKRSFDGINGLKNEISYTPLRKAMKRFIESNNPLFHCINMLLYFCLTGLCGHIVLLVFKKRQ